MDPLVELIQRWDTRHPYDHSLDGFPLTPAVVALLCILGVSLALGLTGRSWKVWYRPAFAVWFCLDRRGRGWAPRPLEPTRHSLDGSRSVPTVRPGDENPARGHESVEGR
jgi:hypothetical protein